MQPENSVKLKDFSCSHSHSHSHSHYTLHITHTHTHTTTLMNDYKSKWEFSIFQLNFITIAQRNGESERKTAKKTTNEENRTRNVLPIAAPILHLIILICCYLFASLHGIFIELKSLHLSNFSEKHELSLFHFLFSYRFCCFYFCAFFFHAAEFK